MQLGPYTCIITTNDQPLEEYAAEVDEERGELDCWVASKDGSPFKIECSFGGTLTEVDAVRLVLSADGEILDTRIAVDCDSTVMNGLRLDSWTILPYVFKPAVKPTEDFDEDEMETEDINDPAWKKRGVITLEMTRVEATKFVPLDDDQPSSPLPEQERLRTILVGQRDISEKKAARRTVSWQWGRDEGVPCAVFHFKHRPKEWLEAYGFMGRRTPDITDAINFNMFNFAEQPEYIAGMREMTLRDQAMA
ncbi:hypothetical protein CALVIDRAFT_561394 [Calocera viscosa TUFC12733]|uniref:DUF7918 domain-containing protein n=1 Tax=Calocera viscosa (strain TUFC12733) TaxID=1330018 RepID=A0A167Q981_CALVF|nr:hypothetical protein CALVIDRAFT_561394 [Calocera viscosa TUFC12733]